MKRRLSPEEFLQEQHKLSKKMEKERSARPPMSQEAFTAQVEMLRNNSRDGHYVKPKRSGAGLKKTA